VPATTVAFGVAFILVGLGGYGLTRGASLTALGPAVYGLVFVVAGLLARDDRRRINATYAASSLSLIGFLASLRGAVGIGRVFAGSSARPVFVVAQAIIAVLALGYIVIAQRSFAQARKAQRLDRLARRRQSRAGRQPL
jgi:hypothetical protein